MNLKNDRRNPKSLTKRISQKTNAKNYPKIEPEWKLRKFNNSIFLQYQKQEITSDSILHRISALRNFL